MKVIKQTIQGIEVLIILMGNFAGFYFEHQGNSYGDYVKLESPDQSDETVSILKDQAHETIQRVISMK